MCLGYAPQFVLEQLSAYAACTPTGQISELASTYTCHSTLRLLSVYKMRQLGTPGVLPGW